MIRKKWIVGVRNRLANLAMECDSVAAIEGCQLSRSEREYIQRHLREVINYIDKRI